MKFLHEIEVAKRLKIDPITSLNANNVQTALEIIWSDFTSHTHLYAGSATAGGAANSVSKALTVGNGLSYNSGTTFNGSTAITISLTNPGTLTAASANSNANSHTHAITSTDSGAISTLVKTDSGGNLTANKTFKFGSNAYIEYDSVSKSMMFAFN